MTPIEGSTLLTVGATGRVSVTADRARIGIVVFTSWNSTQKPFHPNAVDSARLAILALGISSDAIHTRIAAPESHAESFGEIFVDVVHPAPGQLQELSAKLDRAVARALPPWHFAQIKGTWLYLNDCKSAERAAVRLARERAQQRASYIASVLHHSLAKLIVTRIQPRNTDGESPSLHPYDCEDHIPQLTYPEMGFPINTDQTELATVVEQVNLTFQLQGQLEPTHGIQGVEQGPRFVVSGGDRSDFPLLKTKNHVLASDAGAALRKGTCEQAVAGAIVQALSAARYQALSSAMAVQKKLGPALSIYDYSWNGGRCIDAPDPYWPLAGVRIIYEVANPP